MNSNFGKKSKQREEVEKCDNHEDIDLAGVTGFGTFTTNDVANYFKRYQKICTLAVVFLFCILFFLNGAEWIHFESEITDLAQQMCTTLNDSLSNKKMSDLKI